MVILIIIAVLAAFAFTLAFIMGVGNLKTPQEQADEDEAQAEYLRNRYLK